MSKLIGSQKFYKYVLYITLPIIIQNLITNLASFLDNVMLGQLGTTAITGVSIFTSLFMVFTMAVYGILSGPSIYSAQFYGNENKEGVRQCFRYKIYAGAFVYILSMFIFIVYGKDLLSLYINGSNAKENAETLKYALNYLHIILIGLLPLIITQIYASSLRETGNTVLPMVAGIIAVIQNFIGNYILIFGKLGLPALGVTGAAVSTTASRFLELAIILIFMQKNEYFEGIYDSLKLDLTLCKEIFIKGLPLFFNELLWSGSNAFISQCYSLKGIEALAAVNIAMTVFNLFMIVCYAMGSAIQIIIGQTLGSGDLEKAYEEDIQLLFLNLVGCILVGGILFLLAGYIPMLYNVSAAVKAYTVSLLQISGFMVPVMGVYYCGYFTIRAGGKTFITFLFDSFFSVVVSLPVAYVLSRYVNISIVLTFLLIEGLNLFKAIIGVILIKKKVWMNNIVTKKEV